MTPSVTPSLVPSLSPSSDPSPPPSVMPSTLPSMTPSESCRDSIDYENPLNEELTCEDFKGLDCLQWQVFGLNASQLIELIENCPVSCGIPCDSARSFSIDTTVKMSNATSSQLGPTTVVILEELTEDFIIDMLSGVALDPVEITSQEQVAGEERFRKLRRLQTTNTPELLLTFRFQGVSIEADAAEIAGVIEKAFNTEDFEFALQRSGDPVLSNVQISTELVAETIPKVVEQENSKGTSSGVVAGAVVAAVAVFVALAGLMVFAQRQQHRKPFGGENVIDFDDFPNSPLAMSPVPAGGGSVNIPSGSSFPLRRSPVGSLGPSVQSPTTSFSFEAANNFVSMVVSSVTNRGPSHILHEEQIEASDKESDATTASSDEVEPHPYMDVVPPMIVIDNIDSDMRDDALSKQMNDIVPGMNLRADSDLVAAINDKTTPFEASVLTDFISKRVDENKAFGSTAEPEPDALDIHRGQSFRVFSSEAEDGETSSEGSDEDDLEITAINEELEYSNQQIDSKVHPSSVPNTSLSMNKKWSNGARPPRIPSEGSISRGSPRSNSDSPVIPHGQESSDSPPTMSDELSWIRPDNSSAHDNDGKLVRDDLSPPSLADHANGTDDAENRARSPGVFTGFWAKLAQKHSSEGGSEGESSGTNRGQNQARRRNSHGSARSGSQDSSNTRANSQNSSHGRNSSNSMSHRRTGSHGSRHARSNSRASSVSSVGSHLDDGLLLSFEAPAKGKLGLVIEKRPFKGVVVTKIKDYSPLLGQVLPGDCVVNVNGTRTDYMGANEIQILLSSGSKTWNGMIRLTILRPDDEMDELGGDSTSHLSFDEGPRPQERQNEASSDFERMSQSSRTSGDGAHSRK